ncbi:MAG: alpha/beta hydrolase, partial [Eubacteriales bacterium]|nr:alpha/beta hydrolase [Eubacteriales bacterium]
MMRIFNKIKNVENTETKKKRRRIVLIILVSILLISFTYEKVGEFIDSKKYEPPGQLIEVNGHMMHIYGEGTSNNTPTVVFTSGWKAP